MNYENAIQHTFNLSTLNMSVNKAYALLSDNTITNVDISGDFATVSQAVADTSFLINGYVYVENDYVYLVSCQNVDFWLITNLDHEESINIRAQEIDRGTDETTLFNSLSDYDLYYWINSYNSFSVNDSSYDSFNFNLDYNDFTVFDNSNTWYPQDSSYLNYQIHQFNTVHSGSTYAVYFRPTILRISREGSIKLQCGAPYQEMGAIQYDNGYHTGYNNGLTTGYNNGFQDGQNSNLDSHTATAFSYMGTAFNAIGGFMDIEILPHITIGTCFSIPLVLVVIMTIFKIVKK